MVETPPEVRRAEGRVLTAALAMGKARARCLADGFEPVLRAAEELHHASEAYYHATRPVFEQVREDDMAQDERDDAHAEAE